MTDYTYALDGYTPSVVDDTLGRLIAAPYHHPLLHLQKREKGVGRGWHDADLLPPPILMLDLCPTLKGSGLTLADVTQAIYDVAEVMRRVGPEYSGEDVRRAMVLSRLEARLHESRPANATPC